MYKITTILFLFVSVLSSAHPHVFINADMTVCYNESGINKLKMKYTFDKIFSNDLIQMFDINKNRKFEDSEVAQVKAKAFSNLVKYDYFVHVSKDGTKIKHKSITDFNATIKDGIVMYCFSVNTNVPIGTKPEKVKIAVYDHSYYIDVVINKQNPKFEDSGNFFYTHKIITDYKQAYYMNQIYPDCVVLDVNKM